MTTLRASDLAVFDGLTIVKIRGFKPEPNRVVLVNGETIDANNYAMDLPGSANWLVEQYGLADLDELPSPGILWTDYDSPADEPWLFACLIDSHEVDKLSSWATDEGYDVTNHQPITEPGCFGDGSGTVTILRHPDGWVLAQ